MEVVLYTLIINLSETILDGFYTRGRHLIIVIEFQKNLTYSSQMAEVRF